MSKTKAPREALTEDKVQQIIAEVSKRLNRNGETAQFLASSLGTTPGMVNRIGSLLRKAGRDITRVKLGLKSAVEKFVAEK